MADAYILFDSRRSDVSLESLAAWLRAGGIDSTVGAWWFFDRSVPQQEVHTSPPFAIQVNLKAEVVAEALELIEGDEVEGSSLRLLRSCDARLEIVSGAQPRIDVVPQGGFLTSPPHGADSPVVLCDPAAVPRGSFGTLGGYIHKGSTRNGQPPRAAAGDIARSPVSGR